MIPNPILSIECENYFDCESKIEFDFKYIINNKYWKDSRIFKNWYIDWEDKEVLAYCPKCNGNNGK